MTSNCKHEYWRWKLRTNEDGWECSNCGLKPGDPEGFSPSLDRTQIAAKVFCILHALHESDLIYVSNGSEGEWIESQVSKRCRELGLFDQYTVIQEIVALSSKSHADYWKKISEGVLSGNDPRDRCHECGKLSKCSTSDGKGGWIHSCLEHASYCT